MGAPVTGDSRGSGVCRERSPFADWALLSRALGRPPAPWPAAVFPSLCYAAFVSLLHPQLEEVQGVLRNRPHAYPRALSVCSETVSGRTRLVFKEGSEGSDFRPVWLWLTVAQDRNLVLAFVKPRLGAGTVLDHLPAGSF